jgi:hypothetical protein
VTKRDLILRLRERLEALWDCTCTPAVECERCSTLREIDDQLLGSEES